VPVVLSTDDAGVSRIDLTNEYLRTARDYRLGYRTLKAIARDGLSYAFLNDHDKREELARFDRASAEFEHSVTESLPFWSRLRSLIAGAFGAGG
jgi:adenosine deaminase